MILVLVALGGLRFLTDYKYPSNGVDEPPISRYDKIPADAKEMTPRWIIFRLSFTVSFVGPHNLTRENKYSWIKGFTLYQPRWNSVLLFLHSKGIGDN